MQHMQRPIKLVLYYTPAHLIATTLYKYQKQMAIGTDNGIHHNVLIEQPQTTQDHLNPIKTVSKITLQY